MRDYIIALKIVIRSKQIRQKKVCNHLSPAVFTQFEDSVFLNIWLSNIYGALTHLKMIALLQLHKSSPIKQAALIKYIENKNLKSKSIDLSHFHGDLNQSFYFATIGNDISYSYYG